MAYTVAKLHCTVQQTYVQYVVAGSDSTSITHQTAPFTVLYLVP